MQEIKLKTWAEFQQQLQELSDPTRAADTRAGHVSEPLFRGQSCAKRKLKTTLERWAGEEVSLDKYYQIISRVKPEIETRTGRTWQIPTIEEYVNNDLRNTGDYPLPKDLCEYLVYLRHHGFPSPFLDWTVSPYIAAYFAFSNPRQTENVAIYVDRVSAGPMPPQFGNEATMICRLSRHVKSHPRHFLQQSQYTVCFKGLGAERKYERHDTAFHVGYTNRSPLLKLILPGSLQQEVLKYLQCHNITAYSLFGSEDKLMESLAISEFVLKK